MTHQGQHAASRICRWAAQRAALPVAEIRAPLLEALQGGADVAVVSGDTGCGKTTQVKQHLLGDLCSLQDVLLVTLPHCLQCEVLLPSSAHCRQ